MQNKSRIYLLIVCCAITIAGTAGCMSAGEDEVVKNQNTGVSDQKGEYKDIVLSDEAAEESRLTADMAEHIRIDAYITPRSSYRDGVALWDTTYYDEEIPNRAYANMEDEEIILNGACTFGDFVEAVDEMAASLGKTYQEKWEDCKGTRNTDYLCYYGGKNGLISVATPGAYERWNDSYLTFCKYYFEGNEDAEFLDLNTVYSAVTELIEKLNPDIGDNRELYIHSKGREKEYNKTVKGKLEPEEGKECYTFICAHAVDGIAFKQAPARCSIKAGNMAEDSRFYDVEGHHVIGESAPDAATVMVGDSGFNIHIDTCREFRMYREPQPVTDINDVLTQIKKTLGNERWDIVITEIELTLSDMVDEEEDGKERLVYGPYWRVIYYKSTENGVSERNILTINAYTGNVEWNSLY